MPRAGSGQRTVAGTRDSSTANDPEATGDHGRLRGTLNAKADTDVTGAARPAARTPSQSQRSGRTRSPSPTSP